MKIRFQADADFNQNIVTGVLRREPTIDFQTALTAGLEGVQDIEVLEIAAKEGRILVSHDRRTMPLHFAEFIITHNSSGVLIVSQDVSIQEAIDTLILIWAVYSSEEWVNRIAYVPF
jgi:predicted nuclease of predicted toxin-antitoxin system